MEIVNINVLFCYLLIYLFIFLTFNFWLQFAVSDKVIPLVLIAKTSIIFCFFHDGIFQFELIILLFRVPKLSTFSFCKQIKFIVLFVSKSLLQFSLILVVHEFLLLRWSVPSFKAFRECLQVLLVILSDLSKLVILYYPWDHLNKVFSFLMILGRVELN